MLGISTKEHLYNRILGSGLKLHWKGVYGLLSFKVGY